MLLFKLAFRNIFRQRRRSLLTALSMAGGYLLCALSFSLVEGSYNHVINFFTLNYIGHVQIHKDDYLLRPKIYKAIDNPESITDFLDQHQDVKSYTLRVLAPGLAYSNNGNSPAQVVGVDLDREKRATRLAEKITTGEYIAEHLDSEGYIHAMIGAGIANTLNIGVGDEIILISQGADSSIANDIFLVKAIMGHRNSSEKFKVFLPLSAAQNFLSMPGKIHEVALILHKEKRARAIAQKLQAELPALSIAPWQSIESTFYKTMQSDKQGNQATLAIIIFIVFIGVLNTVLMSVLERTREFGVLKAMGSRPLTIATLITTETTILALLSIAIGFLCSLPLLIWFSLTGIELTQPVDVGGLLFSHMKGELSWYVFTTPMLLVLMFAILVSIPPGIRAAKIDPTQAMQSY